MLHPGGQLLNKILVTQQTRQHIAQNRFDMICYPKTRILDTCTLKTGMSDYQYKWKYRRYIKPISQICSQNFANLFFK